MSAELLASGVFVVEEDPKISSLPSIPTAVLGAVGTAEKGPFTRTLAQSWPEWYGYFGNLLSTSDLSIAAAGYFLCGGKTLWTKRTCHYSPNATSESNRTSAKASKAITTTLGSALPGEVTGTNSAPFNMAPGDTLTLKVDGAGEETATFDAAQATVTGSMGTYPTTFGGGETILLEMNGGDAQIITFTSGAQSIAQVIDEINPQLLGGYADDNGGELRITSDLYGTDSEINITGGTALGTLGLSIADTQDATSDVANIDAVTAAEVETIVEADTTALVVVSGNDVTIQSAAVGSAHSIQITATGELETVIGLDTSVHSGSDSGASNMGTAYGKYEGAYANSLSVVIAAATSGDSDEFNLSVTKNSVVQEIFPNLSTVTTAARYWADIINTSNIASKLITITDDLVGTPPANRPDNGTYTLTGGSDGLVGLVDADFVGDSAGGTGLYGLDQVDNLTLLIVPGRATATVHQAMLDYCEEHRKGRVFAILDSPEGYTAAQMVTYVKTTAAIKEYSEHGAIYWPRIRIANPDATEFTSDADGLITVPPSGHIAGVFARTDAARPGGVYDYPAGILRGKINGCLGFETDEVLDEEKRKLVYPERINPIMAEDGSVRHIDGSRTLKSTGHFPFIAQRRGATHIEQTVRVGLQFARHARNTRSLRSACFNTVQKYLITQMKINAFRTKKASTAFNVNFSDGLNPASVQDSGQLIGEIGLNMAPPAEFIVLYFSQDTRALDAEIAESTQGR